MALNIKHAEADRLARELAAVTGKSLTQAVVYALREELARQQRRPAPLTARHVLQEARSRLARLAVRDTRTADEILGYGERGLPGEW